MKKKINKSNDKWIIILLGIVFISAGLYRIFNYGVGVKEFQELKTSQIFLPLTIILELVLGTLLVLNKKVNFVLKSLLIFLGTAITIGVITNFKSIFSNINELFTFQANPTDILLHISYGVIILLILLRRKE